MADDSKARVLERIRKLLAMTEGRGATEAEASSAIHAAQRLMEEHGFSIVDVESAGFESMEWTHQAAWIADGLGDVETPYVAVVVSQAFNVRLYDEYRREPELRTETRVFGEPVNVEVACWALRYLRGVFQDLWTGYRVATKCRKTKQRAYYYGLTLGMQNRLDREKAAKAAANPGDGSGKELALAYNAKLHAAFDEHCGETTRDRTPRMPRDKDVARAGRNDGGGINLSRPLAETEIRAIGSKRGD